MKTWKLIVGVLCIFVAGMLLGLLPGIFLRHHFPPPPLPPHPMNGPGRASFILERLSMDLALTEQQKNRVGEIVKETEQKLDSHFQKVQPEIRKIFDNSFSQIEKVLDDKQKQTLRAMRERMENRRRMGPPFP